MQPLNLLVDIVLDEVVMFLFQGLVAAGQFSQLTGEFGYQRLIQCRHPFDLRGQFLIPLLQIIEDLLGSILVTLSGQFNKAVVLFLQTIQLLIQLLGAVAVFKVLFI